jgi:hypothetical protein
MACFISYCFKMIWINNFLMNIPFVIMLSMDIWLINQMYTHFGKQNLKGGYD